MMRPTACAPLSVLLLSVLLLLSCARPRSYEEFVTITASQGGVYSFKLDMSDSLCTYDIWLYNRVESTYRGKAAADIPLNIVWIAPDSTTFVERVYMRSGGRKGAKELYRGDVVPAVPGIYGLQIRPADVPEGFNGIGTICVRKNGTR